MVLRFHNSQKQAERAIRKLQLWRNMHYNFAMISTLKKLFPEVAACYTAQELQALEASYNEPHRHYHAACHIIDLLEKLDKHRAHASRPDLIVHAILWHDVVYNTTQKDSLNVQASANLFISNSVALSAQDKAAVLSMILSTDGHTPRDATQDTALFLDLDLSVLAESNTIFTEKTAAIRKEYAQYPDSQFYEGRSAFLKAYLEKKRCFTIPLQKKNGSKLREKICADNTKN